MFKKRMWLVKLSFRDAEQKELGTSEFSVMAASYQGAQREVSRQVLVMRDAYADRYPAGASVYSAVSLAGGEFICVV